MRYRRTYTRRNADGSFTRVSYGLAGREVVIWAKLAWFALLLGAAVLLLGWPVFLVSDVIARHGAGEWAGSIAAEVVWLGLLGWGAAKLPRHPSPGADAASARPPRRS